MEEIRNAFKSYVFVLGFLPIVIAGYYLCNKLFDIKIGKLFLLVMSVVFSSYLTLYNTISIVLSSLLNYALYLLMKKSAGFAHRKKVYVVVGIIANLLNLLFLKYYNFFIGNLNGIFDSSLPILKIILPLGISFYTFQQIMFIVETYKNSEKSYAMLDYFLYVFYFPKLIQGPLTRHDELIDQFNDRDRKKLDFNNFSNKLVSFTIGLAKKVLIADSFGRIVNWGYLNVTQIGTLDTLFVVLFYTLQIYFDFSGYCDMANGVSLMLNIKLPINFNSPYKAVSVSDFWKRWHITLTTFFTRYVYIPLGGSRKGLNRTLINTFFIFVLSGLWHGSNWTFILWGALHGLVMIMEKFMGTKKFKINKYLSWLMTFSFLNLTWVFFRSENLAKSMQIFRNILSMNSQPLSNSVRDTFFFPEFELMYSMLSGNPVINRYFLVILFALGLFVVLYIVFR